MIFRHAHLPEFIIPTSAGGHLGCFHFLTIVNRAATNMNEHVSLVGYSLGDICPREVIGRDNTEQLEQREWGMGNGLY